MGRLKKQRKRVWPLRRSQGEPRTYPESANRRVSLRQWDREDKILVGGESLAVLAAIAAIPVEFNGDHGRWLVIAATIIGSAALLWYAIVLILRGEKPLTSRMAHRIRTVAYAMEMEQQGVVFDWDGIDDEGRIPMDITNWEKLTPEGKAVHKRMGGDRALLSTGHIQAAQKTANRRMRTR